METIGFATEFYTLWDVTKEEVYFTDSYGKHHLTGIKTINSYIKNISIDLAKVKALYPTLTIDENLKGHSRSFSVVGEDLTPHILKFGKHCGKTIQEVSEIDFGYILWLIKDSFSAKVRELCNQLPSVIAHFEKLEQESKERIESHPVIESGSVKVTFLTNPNKIGGEINFISNNARKLGNIPATLTWVVVNEYTDKRQDWFLLEQATVGNYVYRILKYNNGLTFHINGDNFNTIEEARNNAEVQELVNRNELNNYYQPTEFAPFLNKFCATATIGEGNTIYVFFDEIKSVAGLYPYNMAVINGKAMKLKNKTMKLNLNVFHTDRNEGGVQQYAKIS